MTLDKNKKYEFAGDVYSWSGGSGVWEGAERSWTEHNFQWLADKGLVKEVREPIVGRGRVTFDNVGAGSGGLFCTRCGLTVDQARNRTFNIVATEVVE